MYKKLLSNLPFNPSLIHQLAFYSKRLQKEAAIRKIGFVFMALTMLLQIFAYISPAQANTSCDPSNNDIIHCGFSSKDEAVRHCRNNDQNFRTILNYYKVSCDALSSATTQSIRSTDYNRKLVSMGRKPFGKPGERSIDVPSAGRFFWRPLWSWDSAGPSSYRVLSTHTSDNQMIMVMYECGNLVTLNDFNDSQPQPDAQLSLAKLNQPTGDVRPGDTINYTLVFANKGGTAAFFSVNDTLPSQLTYQSSQYGGWIFENKSPRLKWVNNTPPFYTFGNTDAFGTPGFIKVQAKVNENVPSGTTICNQAWLEDVSVETKQVRQWSRVQVCNTVRITCPDGEVLNDSGTGCIKVTVPTAECTSLAISKVYDRTKRAFTATAKTLDGATIKSYTYNFGDKSSPVTHKSSRTTDSIDHTFAQPGTYDVSVTLDTSVGKKTSAGCTIKAIIAPPDGKPLLGIGKKAKNITKNGSDANGSTAAAGDTIEYALTTTNYGDGDAKDVILQPEDLADVLEYSTLDTTSLQGGVFDTSTKVLAWNSKVTIKTGQAITKTFRIKIKDPIPGTPQPAAISNRNSYDLVMTNVYGNTVNINLPKSPTKVTETVGKDLPQTGPGAGIALSIGFTIVVGYFFARSRILAKELDIIKTDYASAGGTS